MSGSEVGRGLGWSAVESNYWTLTRVLIIASPSATNLISGIIRTYWSEICVSTKM